VQALTSKALVLLNGGRPVEAQSLLETALSRARAAGLHAAWWRAANNLAFLFDQSEQYDDDLALSDEIEAQARQRGDRERLAAARLSRIGTAVEVGRWQDALALAGEADQLQASPWAFGSLLGVVPLHCEQGNPDTAQTVLDGQSWQRDAEQADMAAGFAFAEARLLRARNRPAEALAAAERGLAHRAELGFTNWRIKHCLVEALEAVLELDDHAKADELLALADALQPGQLTPSLRAQRHRFHARLDARRGIHDHVDHEYSAAETTFREHGLVFHHAVTQLEHAEWLTAQGRADEAQPLLAQSRDTFEQLEAKPWLDRLGTAETARSATVHA
jgi:tetratricopeptide (TPR) repeat protein